MNTHETYVSLETAKLLKQAGFDWEVPSRYFIHLNGDVTFYEGYNYEELLSLESLYDFVYAPTLAVAQRWLRENKDFDINILTDFDSVKRLYYVRYVVKDGHYKTYYITKNQSYVYFNTYEEAQEAGILKCLTLLLEKDERITE